MNLYLLFHESLSHSQRKWLMTNAIPVAPLVWVFNEKMPGAVCVRAGSDVLSDLSKKISIACYKSLEAAEEAIKEGKTRGRAKRLILDRLHLISGVAPNIDIVRYAMDLAAILGEAQEKIYPESKTTSGKENNSLGIDEKSVKDYIINLAKSRTIH